MLTADVAAAARLNGWPKDCLPPDVAERGLRIVRLDGKPVPVEIEQKVCKI